MPAHDDSARPRAGEAAGDTVERLRTDGRTAVLRQDVAAAESAFVAAIEAAEGEDPQLLVDLYRDLAGVCRLDGRFAQARDLTQAADLLRERLEPAFDQSPAGLLALADRLRAVPDRREDLGLVLLMLARAERQEAAGRQAAAGHLAEAVDIFAGLGTDERRLLELRAELITYQVMTGDTETAVAAAAEIHDRLREVLPLHASGLLRTLAQRRTLDGDTAGALAYAEEAVELARDGGDPTMHAGALGALALVLGQQGDTEGAAGLLRQALVVAEQEEQESMPTAINLVRLGTIERRLGQVKDSTAHLTRAVEILRAAAPRSSELGDALAELGDTARSAGEMGAAAAAYREAAALAADAGQQVERQLNLGNVQKGLNLLDDAERTLTAALRQAEPLGNASLTAAVSLSLAGVLRWRGDLDGAERVYTTYVDDESLRAQVLSNLAGIAYDRRRFTEAAGLYRQAVALAEEQAPNPEVVTGLIYNLATAVHGAEQFEEADELYAAALDRLPGNGRARVEAWSGRAAIAAAQDRLDDAVALMEQAIADAERLRSAAGGDASRAALSAVVRRHYLGLIHVLLRRGAAGDAELSLGIVELARARILEERLSATGAPGGQQIEEQRLRRKLGELSRQRLAAVSVKAPDPGVLATLTAQEQELAAALEALPRPVAATAVLTGEQIRAALPDGALLLEYQPLGEDMHLWAVTRQHVEHHVLTTKVDAIADLVLRVIGPYHAEAPDRSDPEAWDELGSALLDPVRSRLGAAGQLLISPDELLQMLSFEPITDRPVVVYMSSATVGLRSRAPRVPRPRDAEFVGLGNPAFDRSLPEFARLAPLPGAEIEVEDIAELFGDRAVALSGAQATESELRSWARRCRYLHIATHAFVDPDNPMRSGLVLATPPLPALDGRPANDDVLHGFEMLDLRIEAELVVCAACRTGFGLPNAGTGLATIGSAMLLGGARWVLVTLWPVGDLISAAFMRVLYEALADGAAVPAAVGAARDEIRLDHPDPYWWAGFVLFGGAA